MLESCWKSKCYGGVGQPAPGYEYPLVLPSGLATPLEPYSPTNNHYAGGGGGYPSGGGGNSLGGGGAPGLQVILEMEILE